jgi:histidinol-phosphate aminotransferase
MGLLLVCGGTRSGKSAVAEQLAAAPGAAVHYVATGSASDAEMAERIARHRARRPPGWRTVETSDPLAALRVAGEATVLVDGLAGWITRLLTEAGLWTDAAVAPLGPEGRAAHDRALARVREFAAAAAARPARTVVVAEESGLGVVPPDAATRRYLDLAGDAAQALAAVAERVLLVVAGHVLELNPPPDRGAHVDPPGRGSAAAPRDPRPEPERAPASPRPAGGPPDTTLPHPGHRSTGVSTGPEQGIRRGGPTEAGARQPAPAQGGPPVTTLPERKGGPRAVSTAWGAAQGGSGAGAAGEPELGELRVHGDTMVRPGEVDFAVNVLASAPPAWLRRALAAALDHTGAYPDERPATRALAARHGRAPEEVVATNGSAEAFWLLASALRPACAVVLHPSFTEPEVALRAAGHPVQRAWRDPTLGPYGYGFALDPERVPQHADLVVVGNPNNPTGTLDPAATVAKLARPGRVLVVDEAFMELDGPGEPQSLAGRADLPGLVVVRSLTKLWALAGVRAGYLLAPPPLAAALRAARQPWSVNALALAALAAWARDEGGAASAHAAAVAREVAASRAALAAALAALPGVRVWPSATNFLLLRVPSAPGGAAVRAGLAASGIAVRRADTFPGLTPDHLRVTVRDPVTNQRLTAALAALLDPRAPGAPGSPPEAEARRR